jgi:hypothetical protein
VTPRAVTVQERLDRPRASDGGDWSADGLARPSAHPSAGRRTADGGRRTADGGRRTADGQAFQATKLSNTCCVMRVPLLDAEPP